MVSNNNIEHLSPNPVGKSDHETLVFPLYICEEKEHEQELKYDLSKGNSAQMRTEFDEFDCPVRASPLSVLRRRTGVQPIPQKQPLGVLPIPQKLHLRVLRLPPKAHLRVQQVP